ncbi:MAG TPA: DUF805 domain-containing protein [Telluria sp.]|jgi:uncharacterized membrane protein YhaH (DUF805 family)
MILKVVQPLKNFNPEPNLSNPYNAPAADMSNMTDGASTYEPQVISLSGRIGRLRYLSYTFLAGLAALFAMAIVGGVASAISPKLGIAIIVLMYIPMVVIQFGYTRRRFNDMNRSGWFALLLFIPVVGFFVALWLMFGPGDESSNDFGLPPNKNSTGVIIGALVFPVFIVAMIGIMAAVAIPAYQQYLTRAQAAQMQTQEPASALPEAQQ